ncbi:uncharacterized protein LOC113745443, partial [Larimichthys crocea]|uniref:uncharacterized protein LOC113745443 n=1 Tax=Larimichthys crocea TaxID=215358 RepID=UPI000F5DA0EE
MKAPPRDPKPRYRFFGYLAAYLSAIYGHRTGVLTRMRVREVRAAIGGDDTGYLINVMEHKTVRKFGTAQIYLEAEEYGWCRTWLRLRARTVPTNGYFFSSLGRGEAKDMARYFRGAWSEMGLKGAPSIMDIRTAVSTFVSIKNTKDINSMCFFFIRELFVCLAVKEPEQAAAAAAGAAAAATTQPREERKGTPSKRVAAINKMAKRVKRKVGLSPNGRKRRPVVVMEHKTVRMGTPLGKNGNPLLPLGAVF